MAFTTPMSLPSGRAERVREVRGGAPGALEDFVGDLEFVLDGGGYVVRGTGRLAEDQVRFYEKDVQANGKDIRTWVVRADGENFLAEPAATF